MCMLIVNLLLTLTLSAVIYAQHEYDHTPLIGPKRESRCYDDFNRPQRCIPEFENAAFNVEMQATNTCGEVGEQEYCVQTGVTGIRKSCEVCLPGQHHATFLTDIHNVDNPTWWQSETILEGIQWPNQVNLTLKFVICSKTKEASGVLMCLACVKIPEEDRGRAPRNVMAMVISKENGFYKLDTANGVLEKMYTRNEFQLSQSEFLTAEDVLSTSFPMRQIAAKETRSKQGFIRCDCKKQCQNKKCKCVTSKIKCNSKCHGSSSCCNK